MRLTENVYVIILYLFLFSIVIFSQASNYHNATVPIGCASAAYRNTSHTKLFYRAQLSSTITLPSCNPIQNNDLTLWMVFADFCQLNRTYAYFARIYANNTVVCGNTQNVSISTSACESGYNFTRQMMTIRNVTEASPKEYICMSGQSWSAINKNSILSFNITIESKTNSSRSFLDKNHE